MAEDKQIELELDDNNDVEVEVKPENTETEEKSVQTEVVEEDQFKKAESSMQKRIDKLTKKMREAERREQAAIDYAKKVKEESDKLKSSNI